MAPPKLDEAVKYTNTAIELQDKQDYQGAVKLWCQAAECYNFASKYEVDEGPDRDKVKEKAKEAAERSEQLKDLLFKQQQQQQNTTTNNGQGVKDDSNDKFIKQLDSNIVSNPNAVLNDGIMLAPIHRPVLATQPATPTAVRLPTYIDSSLLRYYSLSTSACFSAQRILWQLSESYPQITFAPTLYPMVAIFLHKHDHDHTYQMVYQLLQKNQQAMRDRQFKQMLMPTTRLEHVRDIIVLIKLCTKFGILAPFWMLDLVKEEKRFLANLNGHTLRSANNCRRGSSRLRSRSNTLQNQQINGNSYNKSPSHNNNNNDTSNTEDFGNFQFFDTPFFDWYKWIFVALPFTYCTRILECWLTDGQKFLYRIALAMLCRFRKYRNNNVSFNTDTMFEFCSKLESTLEPKGGVEQLIKEAKSLKRIPTKKIAKVSRKAETKANLIVESLMRNPLYQNQARKVINLNQPRDDMIKHVIISSRIAPRNLNSSIINNYELLDDLWQYIPERAAVKTASIVFNSNNDGTSLQTFFSRVEPYEETIIIIRTTKNEVFGSFCSSSWSLRHTLTQSASTKSCYFGNGETFLFTLWPRFSVYLWVGKTDSDTNTQHYNNNHFHNNNHHRDSVTDAISTQLFMSATSQELIIGSGNGSFGLWLDADLTRGKTDHCRTFNNFPLCPDKDFTCKDVEVLAFA